MSESRLQKDGAEVGTVFLAAASIIHGKMVIIGDLLEYSKQARSEIEAAVRNTASAKQPMHVVEVKVVARVLQLDSSNIAPPEQVEDPSS